MTRRELYKNICRLAEPIYGSREATQIAYIILDEIFGADRMALLRDGDVVCGDEEHCQRILREVSEGRPVQYIVGEADFCDFRVVVREGCLIPRPESEELIRWVVEDYAGESARILDIGSGSGALAIALRRAIEGSEVTTLDISPEALAIAKENVTRLSPDVRVVEGDALAGVERYVDGEFNIIISNPPYIPQSEEVEMRCNVTKYEPHIALFVSDDDPLIFYRRIAQSAYKLLSDRGSLYFEIHERLASETTKLLREIGFEEVELRLDINDKPRMICARRVQNRH